MNRLQEMLVVIALCPGLCAIAMEPEIFRFQEYDDACGKLGRNMLRSELDESWPVVARKILQEAKGVIKRISELKKLPKKEQTGEYELLLAKLRWDPNFGRRGLQLRFENLNDRYKITGASSIQGDDAQEDRAVYNEIKKLLY
jgi:hypothetical protein